MKTKALNITLTISSIAQLEALQAALDLYVDMEGEREKDGKEAGFGYEDGIRLAGARSLQKEIA